MFTIQAAPDGTVVLEGRLDAASAPLAREFLAGVETSVRLDFSGLEYIASIGLGLLVAAQRRLMVREEGLTLAGLSPHLSEVFQLAGFAGVFVIE